MTYRQHRLLFALKEAATLALSAPAWALGFVARCFFDRFHEGYEAAYDWRFGLRQQRETYQIDDQVGRPRG